MIQKGCVIISQHSDTIGPAVACEQAKAIHEVYHVGYNQSMSDVAPTTSLISSKINWAPYVIGAVNAVLNNEKIEKSISGNIYGNDMGAGFDEKWIEMLPLNETVAAKGTQKEIDKTLKLFQRHQIQVFKGDYIAVNPQDETDNYDLSKGYQENAQASAPSFGYILTGEIEVVD